MGSVYRARDTELDEDVALKVLHRDVVGSPSVLARFRQEVKLARRVTHTHEKRGG
jgi:serine/threonine-protein kinase